MPTYATLVKFISQGLGGIGDPEKAYNEGIKMVAQMGIKTISAYATLGPYDLMLLYEAPDEKVAAGVATAFALKWAGQSETWTLISIEEFAKVAARLKR